MNRKGDNMKKDIHPQYGKALVHCACGNEFETRSTLKNINVEICSKCHPFFTGKQKLLDTTGRVERFKNKYSQFHKEQKASKTNKTPKA